MYESKEFWRFSLGTGTKNNESACSHLARFKTYEPFISLIFQFFFFFFVGGRVPQ
jgi:hypothetical protein